MPVEISFRCSSVLVLVHLFVEKYREIWYNIIVIKRRKEVKIMNYTNELRLFELLRNYTPNIELSSLKTNPCEIILEAIVCKESDEFFSYFKEKYLDENYDKTLTQLLTEYWDFEEFLTDLKKLLN